MIFPWLLGFKGVLSAPLTWLLFLGNVFTFIFLSWSTYETNREIDQIFKNQDFLNTQSLVFSDYVQRHPANYSQLVQAVGEKAQQGHLLARQMMSGLALKDDEFLKKSLSEPKSGDQVALKKWKETLLQYRELRKKQANYIWGISSDSHSYWQWVSYQFVHAGFAHLIVNMFFLLIFGAWIESKVSKKVFALLYLAGGVAAALSFYFLTGLSQAPLVGASGAINALVGFFAVKEFGQRQNFMYLLLPTTNYSGQIELPNWIFLMGWVLADLSNLLSHVSILGGVAYAAHLGGFLFGALFALTLHVLDLRTNMHKLSNLNQI